MVFYIRANGEGALAGVLIYYLSVQDEFKAPLLNCIVIK